MIYNQSVIRKRFSLWIFTKPEKLSIFSCASTMVTTFLSLPPELRNQIYRNFLTSGDEEIINITYGDRRFRACNSRDIICSNEGFLRRPFSSWVHVANSPVRTSILYTCRRIYLEVSSIIYDEIELLYSFGAKSWRLSHGKNDPIGVPSWALIQLPENYLLHSIMPLSVLERIKRLSFALNVVNLHHNSSSGGAALNFFAVHAASLESFSVFVDFGHGGHRGEQKFILGSLSDLKNHLTSAITQMTRLGNLVVKTEGYRNLAKFKVRSIQKSVEIIVTEGGWKLLVADCQSKRVRILNEPDEIRHEGYWRLSR